MRGGTAQAKDLLFTTRRNQVKSVKYILNEAALRGPAGGKFRMRISIDLTKIKGVVKPSVMNARGDKFVQVSHGMRAVLPCGANWSPASLKLGFKS